MANYYSRARALLGWKDFPDTSSGLVSAADLEQWDEELYQLSLIDNGLPIREKSAVFDEIYVKEGVAAVCLCHDDGPAVDYTTIYPYLRDRTIPGSFAIIQGSVTGGTNLTWTQLKEMHTYGMEIVCHSRTHGSAPASVAAFYDETVAAADDLALTDGTAQVNIDGFVQPGTWASGTYLLDSTSKVDLAPAGRVLRSRYAVATAYVSDGIVQNVVQIPPLRKIGSLRGSDLSTITLAQLKQKVSQARGQGGLVACGTHAARLGIDNSVATWKTLIDYLAAERDAGRVEFYTLSAAYNLKHSATGRRNLLQDGGFALDAAGNPLAWIKSGGAPVFTTSDAPGLGAGLTSSLTIASSSDTVLLELPAPPYRTLHIRFKAKNAVAGVGSNSRLIIRGQDTSFTTTYNSVDHISTGVTTPGPWVANTDAYQTFECLFRPDARSGGILIWPYWANTGGRVGGVKYADFEIYKT